MFFDNKFTLMLLNILLIIILGIGLLINFKKTILMVACSWPFVDMLGGIGPISLMKVFGIMAIGVALFFRSSTLKKNHFLLWSIPLVAIAVLSNYLNERHTPTMLGYVSTVVFLPIVMFKSVRWGGCPRTLTQDSH